MCALRENQTSTVEILKEVEAKISTERKALLSHENVHLDDIYGVVKLIKDPDNGLKLKDKKKYLMIYKHAFTGSEIVDWILQNLPVRTRDDAVQLCQKILDSHFIQNAVKPKAQFKDGKSLYQFIVSDQKRQNITYNLYTWLCTYHFQDTEDFHALKAKISSMREETVKIGVEDFQMLKVLGEGSTGKVFLARKHDNKKLYAIKAMDKHTLIEEGELETLLSEKTILQNDSPFLIHLHYSFQTTSHLFFAMDFIGGGDLSFHLKREEKFSEQTTQFIVAELVLAIEYLHSRSVVYRDLKPENILIDNQGHICLTDFGLSKIIPNETATMETACGSPAYTAPEVLEGVGYTKSVDWWSLGVIMYQMLLGFVRIF
jgi:tRNA A-37 threonylcarbamoyl transferase component Bud32